MFKAFVPVFALLLAVRLHAQDLATAQTLFNAKDYVKAKTAIDKAVNGTEAGNPAAWLLKHKICYALGTSAGAAAYPDALLDGLRALRKCADMPDGDDLLMKEIGENPAATFYQYYQAFVNNGSSLLNKEDYAQAYNNFVSALAVGNYLYQEKLTSSAIDTLIVFYAGYCASKNNDPVKAESHFLKLTDNKCSGTDLQIAYGWLANYYIETKKTEQAKTVCAAGLKFYPDDDYLKSKKLELDRLGGNAQTLFKSYEDILASGKAAFTDYLSYGAELYDYLYVDAKATATEKTALQKRLEEIMTKALQMKSGSAVANYLMGMFLSSKANGNQHSDPAAARTDAERSAVYLEKAVSVYEQNKTPSASDKENLKTALSQLVRLYKYLGKPESGQTASQKLTQLN